MSNQCDAAIRAIQVGIAEGFLYQWACGDMDNREVRKALKKIGVTLLDRLTDAGLPCVDAEIDGVVVELRF